MSTEGTISWELLKNLANALDSYRIRALIDAKQDVLESGIYNEIQYDNLLLNMLDEEKLKYSLYDYLRENKDINLEGLKLFSNENSVDFYKVLSVLELLKNEQLILVEELFDTIKGDEDKPDKHIFKDYSIKPADGDISNLKSIYEPVKVIFDAKVCSGCGLCAGICPVNCLQIYNGFGKIDEDKCISCGLCYFICPRSYLPVKTLHLYQDNATDIKEYSNIGPYLEVYSARTKIKTISEVCQDGGLSSTCLHYLFDKNQIDFAVGAKMSNTPWRPESLLLKNKEDIITTAGTKYVNNANLQILNQKELKDKKLAVVGVPCQMQALLKSNIYNIGFPSINNVEYKIGIFCMESFSYESILKICEVLKVDVKDVKKMDINKGKFFVYTIKDEELSVPIKEISHLAREDCEVCFDLTSESADISIGSIGSPSGWNTVVIRNEKGKKLYEELIANNLIESKNIEDVKPGLPLLQRIAGIKKNTCNKHITAKKNKAEKVPSY